MMILWECLLFLALLNIFGAVNLNENDSKNHSISAFSWMVVDSRVELAGQSITIRKVSHFNKFHTCYEAVCSDRNGSCAEIAAENPSNIVDSVSVQFCYPAIIVTGLKKCGTSAMYHLLSRVPGAILMPTKENCPFRPKGLNLWQYFQSLPRMDTVMNNSVIVGGCHEAPLNMRMRKMLKIPKVHYIVVVRDYANMLWSAYNYWCKPEYDKQYCNSTFWVDEDRHTRSPEAFHRLVKSDMNGNVGIYPWRDPIQRPCFGAKNYFSHYIDHHLFRNNVPRNNVTIFANEQLEQNPLAILTQIATTVGINITTLNTESVSQFSKVRMNVQEKKGDAESIPIENYNPGLYKISKYQPMFAETRKLLNKCWYKDCVRVANATHYSYAACAHKKEG